MSPVLRLGLLAPDVVEAIVDGRQPERNRGGLEGQRNYRAIGTPVTEFAVWTVAPSSKPL